MEPLKKDLQKSIELYLKEKHPNKTYEDFIIKENQIDGMTNKNYQVIYYDKSEPKKVYEFLYRKYGDILDLADHDKEIYIINYLASKKEGPSVLYACSNYRIIEFVKDSSIIPLELRYDKKVLSDIINILCNYPFISNIYKYSFNPNLNLEHYYNNKHDGNTHQFPTLLDISEKLIIKAKDKYELFNKKFNEFFSKNALDDNIKLMKAKYDLYMNNYKEKLLSLFPKKGFFVLCHNDCHRWNFLFKNLETKLLIIDHEYACLSIPGLDLCNYFNENSFYFYENGNYEFKKEEINLEFYYEQYQKYCELFFELNKNWVNKEENKEIINEIKSKEYYFNLHSITNVFWFLFCVINLNFEEEFVQKSSHYFQYGFDRLFYSELVKKKE